MATATVTISRALSTDTKPIVSATPQYHGGNVTNFRPIVQQQPQPQHQQQVNNSQHANNHAQMSNMETPPTENSSRTATPAEATALPAGQLQLPPTQPAQPAQPAPAPVRKGPIRAAITLPPRAKPGRKPMNTDDASDRRKMQNREAQRHFRDKRAQKVQELTNSIEEQRRASELAQQEAANKLHAKQERINALLRDIRAANDLAASLQQQLDEERKLRQAAESEVMHSRELHSRSVSERMGFPNSVVQTVGTSMALPPISNAMNTSMNHGHASQAPDPYAEHEIDVTAQWLSKNLPAANNQADWISSDMDVDKPEDDKCGFCTDSGPCPCREDNSRKPKPTLAPGGCDACIADPERAARCKALAEKSEVTQRPDQFTTTNGGSQSRNDSVAQPTEYMSCSKLFDRSNPRMPSISELFPGAFHAYPSQNSGAGFDVNEHEVAQVLQSMSRNDRSS